MSTATPEQRVIKQISLGKIPAFPTVVLRVLDIVSQDDPDLNDLVQEIASDTTLSAQVLRLANSPLFGFTAQIRSIHHAVVALGINQVQSLVTSVATANYSRAALRTEALQKVWRHTLASAVLAREIARAAGIPADQAYSLGLLHDIGRLGLLVAWPDDYDRILQEADRDSMSILDLEKRLFGMDHCEVGRRLVEQWKLPAEFCVVAGRHHDPPAGATNLDTLRIAWFACQLADCLGYWVARPLHPPSFDEIYEQLPSEVQQRLPRDAARLEELVEHSVTRGGDILGQPHAQHRSPACPAPVNIDSQNALPEPGSGGVEQAPEFKTVIAGDFAIVLTTVFTFAALLGLIFYLRQF